jgi:hypothetical protein
MPVKAHLDSDHPSVPGSRNHRRADWPTNSVVASSYTPGAGNIW